MWCKKVLREENGRNKAEKSHFAAAGEHVIVLLLQCLQNV